MKLVYGPVPSWRLGRSLGVDALGGTRKRCTYDCCYCQLGPTPPGPVVSDAWVSPAVLAEELAATAQIPADYITFSGLGEPTLASNLADLLDVARTVRSTPLAVLTNGSLLVERKIRSALRYADLVIIKVDALDEESFWAINRPRISFTLAEILDGVRAFRRRFQGRLALQMMFIEGNACQAEPLAELARSLRPAEIQLNTPLRPSPTPPVPPEIMAEIARAFEGLPAVNVYTAQRPVVSPLDLGETRRRRPEHGDPCAETAASSTRRSPW